MAFLSTLRANHDFPGHAATGAGPGLTVGALGVGLTVHLRCFLQRPRNVNEGASGDHHLGVRLIRPRLFDGSDRSPIGNLTSKQLFQCVDNAGSLRAGSWGWVSCSITCGRLFDKVLRTPWESCIYPRMPKNSGSRRPPGAGTSSNGVLRRWNEPKRRPDA